MDPNAQRHNSQRLAAIESENASDEISDAQSLVDRINDLIKDVGLYMPDEIGTGKKSSRDWVVGHLDDAASEVKSFIAGKSEEVIGEQL